MWRCVCRWFEARSRLNIQGLKVDKEKNIETLKLKVMLFYATSGNINPEDREPGFIETNEGPCKALL
jgi:hypothetical protein